MLRARRLPWTIVGTRASQPLLPKASSVALREAPAITVVSVAPKNLTVLPWPLSPHVPPVFTEARTHTPVLDPTYAQKSLNMPCDGRERVVVLEAELKWEGRGKFSTAQRARVGA